MMISPFIVCFFGDKTREASSKLTTQMYHSNWIQLIANRRGGKKFSKIMLILMANTQRETMFYLGALIPLNLRTFQSVIL